MSALSLTTSSALAFTAAPLAVRGPARQSPTMIIDVIDPINAMAVGSAAFSSGCVSNAVLNGPAAWFKKMVNSDGEDSEVTSWYDAGVRLDAVDELVGRVTPLKVVEAAASIELAEAAAPIESAEAAAPTNVFSGIVKPMPPPGFEWADDAFDGDDLVAPAPEAPTPTTAPVEEAAAPAEVMSVAQACVFMADESASTADKKAYLSSKGVSDFVIAQAECIAPEDNVQGHPELPATGPIVGPPGSHVKTSGYPKSRAPASLFATTKGAAPASATNGPCGLMTSGYAKSRGAPASLFVTKGAAPASSATGVASATTPAVESWYDAGTRLPSGPDAAFAEAVAAAALTGAGRLLQPADALTYLSGAAARTELLAAGVPLDVIRDATAVVAAAAEA